MSVGAYNIVKTQYTALQTILKMSAEESVKVANIGVLHGAVGTGRAFVDASFAPCRLSLCHKRNIVLVPGVAKYTIDRTGNYTTFTGNSISMNALSVAYKLSCYTEYAEKNIQELWKERYGQNAKFSPEGKHWYTLHYGDIWTEVGYWAQHKKRVYLNCVGAVCDKLAAGGESVALNSRAPKPVLLRDGDNIVDAPEHADGYALYGDSTTHVDDLIYGKNGYGIFYDGPLNDIVQYMSGGQVWEHAGQTWFYPLAGRAKTILSKLHGAKIRYIPAVLST